MCEVVAFHALSMVLVPLPTVNHKCNSWPNALPRGGFITGATFVKGGTWHRGERDRRSARPVGLQLFGGHASPDHPPRYIQGEASARLPAATPSEPVSLIGPFP